ncbi:MAG: NACHT domain-containing protein [Chloroflexi bacterium]|nr:NACHT domain-containing protein [Chloroflexota bacterium]
MYPRLPTFAIDPFSFWAGFLVATVFWWLLGRIGPLLTQIRQGWQERRETSKMRGASSVEEHHRQATLHRAQGMHLAAPLFSLEELIIPPRLLAPPQRIEPGQPLLVEDLVSQTVPYMPARPEMAAVYRTPSLTIPQALSGGVHLVIVGYPGIGKTVALAHLATLSANRAPQLGELSEAVPFLLHVADLKLPIKNPDDLLDPIVESASGNAPMFDLPRLPGFIRHTFRSGRALFLLDGLDELPPDEAKQTVEYLGQLIEAFPKIQIVTTGCPEHLYGLLDLGFSALSLMAWGPQQQERFLEKWGNLWERYVTVEAWVQTGPEQVDPILLNSWLSIDNAGFTPLEMTLKAWGAYAGDGRGPTALDAIETHLRRISPPGVPVAALEMLAMQVSLTSQPIFDSRKAREWVKSFEPPEEKPAEDDDEIKGKSKKEKATPTLSLLAKMSASGLLFSHRDNRMRFVHPIFGGFLAGRALTSYNADETLLNQPAWSGKFLAMQYLAAKGDASALVEALLEKPDPILERNLFVVARWLRDAPRKAPWRGKVMTRLASTLQNDTLPLRLRGQIVTAFALSRDPGAAPLFRQFIRSKSPYLVQLAALGSGLIQDTKAVESLAATFLMVPNSYVWSAACLALVAIGTTPALEAVATALLRGDENLRRAAAEALANHPTEGWAMLRDGLTMSDLLVRRSAVYGLARLDQAWVVELLEKTQIEDKEWVVRNVASDVLESKQQPDLRIPRPLPPPSESPWLIEFAGKQGMGISPGAPATEILLLALKSEDMDERLAALPYLRQTPSKGVLGGLYHAMQGGNIEMREAVFLTLWEMGASGVALSDPQEFGVG